MWIYFYEFTYDFLLQFCDHSLLCKGEGRDTRLELSKSGFQGPVYLHSAVISSNFYNTPPKVTSQGVVTMKENQGNLLYRLEAIDEQDDRFIFILNNTKLQNGELSLLESGMLYYTPCLNCFGSEQIDFYVEEIRQDGQPALVTPSILTIHINKVNNNPVLLVIEEGYDITSQSYQLDLLLKENRETNIEYEDLKLFFAVYDVDGDDSLVISIQLPDTGEFFITTEAHDVIVVPKNCSLSWEDRQHGWNLLKEDLLAENTKVYLPYPCNSTSDVSLTDDGLTWLMVYTMYTPQLEHHGEEELRVCTSI